MIRSLPLCVSERMTAGLSPGTIRRIRKLPALAGGLPELIVFMPPAAAPPATAAGPLTLALRLVADRIPRLRIQEGRISEQDTKRILITPAVEALGWDILDIDEVRNEYRHNSADNPVDYALFLNRSPVLFIEAKPLGHSLDDRKWIVQTINYANAAGVDWCVLTNGAEWRIYKVHAQVEADRKLFTAVTIEAPEALDDAVRVLTLLSRDNMRAHAIDELWQAWHVDRQVQAALEQTFQDDAFAALIRKRVPQLGVADIRKSLRRASIAVSYPNIFREVRASPAAVVMPAASAPEPSIPATEVVATVLPAQDAVNDTNEPGLARRRFQSTQDSLTSVV